MCDVCVYLFACCFLSLSVFAFSASPSTKGEPCIYILIARVSMWVCLSVDNEAHNQSPSVHSSPEGGDAPFSSLRFTSLHHH